jgi:DNA-binding transcriptional ArsR family regulator
MRTHRSIFVLQAEICRGLAHPVRLEVLHLLGAREASVGDLLRQMSVTKTRLSQHLAVLRRARIVTSRREGSHVFYRLTYPEIATACDAVSRALSRHLAVIQNETSVLLRRVGGVRGR